ncbi:unnamed protein product [Trifolium pratense]|uniref:Uncharacterized protein n=1 Tax=Trifolium pratense TaxID=57577 RepID=A0ACB0IKJ5_TRIPR|nr:unnamed protein product [Trifolium pratense]
MLNENVETVGVSLALMVYVWNGEGPSDFCCMSITVQFNHSNEREDWRDVFWSLQLVSLKLLVESIEVYNQLLNLGFIFYFFAD